jgi:hypothetical protein
MVLRRAVEDRRLNFGSFGIFSIFSRSESGVDKDFANSCRGWWDSALDFGNPEGMIGFGAGSFYE